MWNQRQLPSGGRRALIALPSVALLGGLLLTGTVDTASAQFHSKTQDGRTVSAAPSPVAAAGNAPSRTIYQTGASSGLIDTGEMGSTLGYTDIRNPEIWGRAIFHDDGTYTESKQDASTNALTQETKSPSGVLIQRRLISLDAKGRPSEVLIYDGRGQYRYRGQIIYDLQGRFQEEQIFDTNSVLLRRRIQEYELSGAPKPLQVIDDASKIPADLKLVITQSDGAARDGEIAQREAERFRQQARENRGNPAAAPASAAEEEKPGLWRRLNPFKK